MNQDYLKKEWTANFPKEPKGYKNTTFRPADTTEKPGSSVAPTMKRMYVGARTQEKTITFGEIKEKAQPRPAGFFRPKKPREINKTLTFDRDIVL